MKTKFLNSLLIAASIGLVQACASSGSRKPSSFGENGAEKFSCPEDFYNKLKPAGYPDSGTFSVYYGKTPGNQLSISVSQGQFVRIDHPSDPDNNNISISAGAPFGKSNSNTVSDGFKEVIYCEGDTLVEDQISNNGKTTRYQYTLKAKELFVNETVLFPVKKYLSDL